MPGYYELEVSLQWVEPRIWRRFQLADVASFLDLHQAVQLVCGWQDTHLFSFRGPDGEDVAGVAGDDGWGVPQPDAATVPVASFFTQQRLCLYEYDFGDSWLHDVALERVVQLSERFGRRLLDGARAFPPEDCGGLPGYEDCLRVVAGGDDPDGLGDWLGDWDPERFDLDETRRGFDR